MGRFRSPDGKTIRDPKGNELVPTLLHVLERGDQGPTLCRVRYDHEKVELDDNPDANEFLLVWAPVNSVLGAMRLEDLAGELHTLRADHDRLQRAQADAHRDNEFLRAENARLMRENETKTAALRELHRERDPELIARVAGETAAGATAAIREQLTTANATIATQKSEIDELRASKKKLREALDRAKGR